MNAHNSDVVKGQALGQQQVNAQLASLLQQKFGNTLQAKQLYDQLQNQVWTNNQTAKQQNFANANTMLNQNTTLGQNQIANANQQTALDQQNFQDRMALQAQLLGQQNQTFNQGITQSNAALGQESLGANIAGGVANTANSATGANVASQNASNMANWQQGINANAATTNAFGQALQGAGYAAGNGNWGTDTTTGRTDGSAADQNAATSATPDWGDTGVSSSSLFAGTPSSTSTSTQPQSSSLFNTYAPVAQSTTAFNPYASTSTNTNPMGYGYIGSNVGGH